MARTAQTELAVLGALSTAPMTGYEVRAAITGTLGHFWHESFGQIYPTLARLAEGGLVRRSDSGRTASGRFEITDEGMARLRELLAEPFSAPPARNALLLRLFFGTELEPGRGRELLEDARAQAMAALAAFAEIREEIRDDDSPAQRYRTMTLSYGEHLARAQLAWAQECLRDLD